MREMLRKFTPGSEWLYIKLYTGIKTADIVLEEAVIPLLNDLRNKGLIKKWFFIRYHDPKPHLRIRFDLSQSEMFGEVLALGREYLQEYIDFGEISGFTLDTYQREVERYGKKTMEDAEFLFWKSSESILEEYLHFDDEEKIVVSMFYIDRMLDFLGLSVQEKLNWIREYNLAFKYEFNADKKLNSQLDKKYRAFIPKYTEFVSSDEYLSFRQYIVANIADAEKQLQNIIENYNAPLSKFFQSIFHMHINRMFISDQRVFEMIIYDYLFRYYKTLAFKNNIPVQ